MTIPDGFERHFRTSRVTDPWEPIFSRREQGTICIGLVVGEAHCNSRGLLHGGVIAALADNAMGLSFVETVRQSSPGAASPVSAVTVNLSIDYLSSAQLGQWLQITPRVIRAGRSLGVVDAIVTAGVKTIARANATFQLIGHRTE